MGDCVDTVGVTGWAAADCTPTPTFCGDGGRWKGDGVGGAMDCDAVRLRSDGWREADLRYESTAPSQSMGCCDIGMG